MSDSVVQNPTEAENGAERGKVLCSNQSDSGEKIDVRRKKIVSVTIYDVTESELTILEKGSDASVWLNFFIGSISIAASFFVALFTVEWAKEISVTQIVFICVAIITSISSIACFVFWRKGRGQHMTTIKAIKDRTLQENY